MNFDEAKQLLLEAVLQQMQAKRGKQKNREVFYFSPFREEKTPSLQVNLDKNIWHDFGLGRGGGVIELVCEYLASQGTDNTRPDALRWLNNMMALPQQVKFKPVKPEPKLPSIKLQSIGTLKHRALLNYLDSRGISLGLANLYLKQVSIKNLETNRIIRALGFINEDEGYELRNPSYKGCFAPKTISFIRGTVPKPQSVHIFEGFMDFLSVAERNKKERLKGDCIVLNSLSNLPKALPYIKGYGYQKLFTWMDNDKAGLKATQTFAEFAQTEEGLSHRPMNKAYQSHKDVNEWHVATRKTALTITPQSN